MMAEARSTAVLHPGTASKIYGMMNFLEQGTYTVELELMDSHPSKSDNMKRARPSPRRFCGNFDVIEAILRQFFIFPPSCLRFVGASDAALECPRQGTGGFCIVWMDELGETREAFVADLPQVVYDLWEPGDRKIAQLEMVVILQALVCRPHRFRECGSSTTWRSL